MSSKSSKAIVFLTTLGQARNFHALRLQLQKEIDVIILYTSQNINLRDNISNYLNAADIKNKAYQLPDRPTHPRPKSLREIKKIYTQIFEEYNPEQVYLCNRETHYHFAIELANKGNVKLVYFEEGLSTYTAQSNTNPLNNFVVAKSIILEIYHFVRSDRVGLDKARGLFKTVLNSISAWLYRSSFWIFLGPLFGFPIMRKFYVQHQVFEDAYLVFPVQNRFVEPKRMYNLDLKVLNNAPEESIGSILGSLPSSIYVAQNYSQLPSYYDAVAKGLAMCLKLMELAEVAIKFHPRDVDETKVLLRKALVREGVAFVEHEVLDRYPMEDFFQYRHFKVLLSQSSTSLLYAHHYDLEVKSISFGPEVIRELDTSLVNIARRLSKDVNSLRNLENVGFLEN